MADDKKQGSNSWVLIPTAVGAGFSGRRAYQDITSGAVNMRNWFRNPFANTQTVRDYSMSNRVVRSTSPGDVTMGKLQQMSQQRTWTTGLNPTWARRAVAESMRASLLSDTRLGISEINKLTANILQPNTIPFTGTDNIFDVALGSVSKYGKPAVFEKLMGRYTSGHMPGEFLNPQEMETLLGAQTGQFFRPKTVRLGAEEQEMFTSLNKIFNQTSNTLGKSVLSVKRSGFYDFGVGKTAKFNVRVNNAAVSVNLPLQSDVFYTRGSRAILPTIVTGVPSAGNLQATSWGEYYANKLMTEVVPEVATQTAGMPSREARKILKQRIQKLDADLSEHFVRTSLGSSPGSDFINRMNARTLVLPELTEQVARQHPERVLDEEFARLYKEGVPGIGQVYPVASGGKMVSGKVFAGIDPRYLFAYGQEFPFERKPGQIIREFSPTPEALQFMRNRPVAGVFRRDVPIAATSYRRSLAQAGVVHPQVMTHYALPGKAASRLSAVSGLAENEVLMTSELEPIFRSQRIRDITIGLEEAIGRTSAGQTGIKEWLLARATGKTSAPYSLLPGEQIGYSPGKGESVLASNLPGSVQEKIIDAKIFEAQRERGIDQDATSRFATLTVLEEHKGPPKTFGTHKAVWRLRDANYLRDIARQSGLHAQNLETIAYTDDIRKSRSLLRQQMIGSLALETRDRLQEMRVLERRRFRMNRLGRMFGGKHEQFDTTQSKIWQLAEQTNLKSRRSMRKFLRTLGSAAGVERMMPNELTMLARAKAWGLDIRNIGGLLPFAKDIVPADVLRTAERLAGPAGLVPESGWIRSLSAQGVGAYSHTSSARNMSTIIQGTIEPRSLLNLAANRWMVEGENVAHMLTGSIAGAMDNYGPDLTELQRAAQSAVGQAVDAPIANLAEKFELSSKGYMLNLGQPLPALGGSSQIYVPGEETVRRLGAFRSATGEVVQTNLFNAYRRLHASAKAAVLASDTQAAIASMNLAAEGLVKALGLEISMSMFGRGGGSGVKGALRSSVAGSAWLRLESVDTAQQVATEGLTYVSERAGLDMFAQLESRTTGEQLAFVRSQRARFMSGEAVAGALSRHPTVGPYHVQPTMIARSAIGDTTERLFAQVPEQIIRSADVGTLGKMDVNISPVVGMFADYDDDRITMMLIGDQKTAAATEKLLSGNFAPYSKYAAEHAILNKLAKEQINVAPPSTIYTDEAMALGGAKLRLGSAEIAKISVPLTEARVAMSAYAPEAAPQFSMLSAIMEEQILKGKKMKTLRQNIAQQVATSMKNIHRAGDIEIDELVRTTQEMFGTRLEAGIPVTMEGIEPWTFQMNTRTMWKQVQEAMYQGTQRGGAVTRYRRLARQQGQQIALSQVLQEIGSAQSGTSDLLTNLAVRGMEGTQPTNRMSAVVSSVLTDVNAGIRKAGAFAKSWGKPLLAGLAVSASIAMVKSGPKAQPMTPPPDPQHGDVHGLSQGDQRQSALMMQGIQPASRDLRPESMPMSPQVSGDPSAPGMPSPKTYMTNSPGYRVVARGSTSGAPDQATVAAAIRPVAPNARAQVTFRDNRRKMTSHDVESILEGP